MSRYLFLLASTVIAGVALAQNPPGFNYDEAKVGTYTLPDPLLTYLAVHGRPIRYRYVTRDWPLDIYQNVYAREPGSAIREILVLT